MISISRATASMKGGERLSSAGIIRVALWAVVIFAQTITFTTALSPEVCTTPRKETGTCVVIKKCQPLLDLLTYRPIPAPDIDYLRQSKCGFLGTEPMVCCPRMKNATSENVVGSPVKEGSKYPDGINTNLLPDLNTCGGGVQDRLYGGEKADLDEFPWMALLEYTTPRGKGFYCGGALINDRYVITAAHCLKGSDLPKTWKLTGVRLGEYDTDTEKDCISEFSYTYCSDPPQDYVVEERIAHEKYNPTDKNQHHDIALLRLTKPVKYSNYIQPICLPTSRSILAREYSSGGIMTVAGWGKTENKSESNIKLKLNIPVKLNKECSPIYKKVNIDIGPDQLCAGGIKGKDSCRGDSGGPLMQLTTDDDGGSNTGRINWYLTGVVSFGPSPCGMDGWPGVYSRVAHYMDWIVSKLRP